MRLRVLQPLPLDGGRYWSLYCVGKHNPGKDKDPVGVQGRPCAAAARNGWASWLICSNVSAL
jgi:hypothetical protein